MSSSEPEPVDSINGGKEVMPFVIVMAAPDELMYKIRGSKNYTKKVLGSFNWTLEKTKNKLYWFINDQVKTLRGQFMMFKNPTVYLSVTFNTSNYIDLLDKKYDIIKKELIGKNNKTIDITVIGFQSGNSKIKENMKIKVLEWCIQHGNLKYIDFKKLDRNEF